MSLEKLLALNVNDKSEKKNGLTYLSWAWAWTEFLKVYPNAVYEIKKDNDGLPYFGNDAMGYMVYTTVTVDGLTREMWLPIMDGANKAMKFMPYTYFDKWKKEKTVDAVDMFDVNKTIMRCLTKNLAMFGLGLYIYACEDLPEGEQIEPEESEEMIQEKILKRKITPIELKAFLETLKSTNSNSEILLSKVLKYQGKAEDMTFELWHKAMSKMDEKAKTVVVDLGL